MDTILELVNFVIAALQCTFIVKGILLVTVVLLIVEALALSKRITSLEKLPSVKDFLKNAKKKSK